MGAAGQSAAVVHPCCCQQSRSCLCKSGAPGTVVLGSSGWWGKSAQAAGQAFSGGCTPWGTAALPAWMSSGSRKGREGLVVTVTPQLPSDRVPTAEPTVLSEPVDWDVPPLAVLSALSTLSTSMWPSKFIAESAGPRWLRAACGVSTAAGLVQNQGATAHMVPAPFAALFCQHTAPLAE